jgi:hypothetical protein
MLFLKLVQVALALRYKGFRWFLVLILSGRKSGRIFCDT